MILKGSNTMNEMKSMNDTGAGGILTSPFFPSRYPRDLGMEYIISCPNDSPACRVRVLFSDFQLAPVSIMEVNSAETFRSCEQSNMLMSSIEQSSVFFDSAEIIQYSIWLAVEYIKKSILDIFIRNNLYRTNQKFWNLSSMISNSSTIGTANVLTSAAVHDFVRP